MEMNARVTELKGVGPKKAGLLKKLGIERIEDFLYFFPRAYQDRGSTRAIAEIGDGETANITAVVLLTVKKPYKRGGRPNLRLLAEDKSGRMEIIFFNAARLQGAFTNGGVYDFYGKVRIKNGKRTMLHPEFCAARDRDGRGILPVYPLTAGISQNDMRKWQTEALEALTEDREYLPREIIERQRLCPENYALRNIHFPETRQKLAEAGYRLVFDELFLLQTGLFYARSSAAADREGYSFSPSITAEEYIRTFPYELTGAQKRVIARVSADMESCRPMNRLIQGDVGSGKTAVAQIALYKAAKNGFQGALMAPTEILARQHYESLRASYEPFGIKTVFLSGSVTGKARKEALEAIKSGETDIVVGTHAMIQKEVEFKRLALAVTDEQHRFGVKQRAALAGKSRSPHILVMTATPIPRTLAVILYGDLDISALDEMPPGRQRIKTVVAEGEKRQAVYDFALEQLNKGGQAYIVAPLIEESEVLDVNSAESVYERLKSKFAPHRVALLHGAMKQSEKDAVMEGFYKNEIQALVSTVVIEVGINVPNATVMIIENSERFGLAQLHQLRGRVGRGEARSYCFLINEGKSEVALERARIMEASSDGFEIAEKDLELRGPGEIFGTKQHGIPELRIADLSKHLRLLRPIRSEAKAVIEEDPKLQSEKYIGVRENIKRFFPETGSDLSIIT